MRCLLDIDGVLADLPKAVYALRGEQVPANYGWDIVLPGEWEQMDEEFWANLDPMPGFDTLIVTLEELFGRSNVCLLSSPVLTHGCYEGKLRWIRKHLPAYSRRFLIGPAKQFCASNESLLVDDYEKNIDAFEAAGGTGFLYPAPHNARHGTPLADTLAKLRNRVFGMHGRLL